MNIKIKKKPFKPVQISILSNDRYEKLVDVSDFIAKNTEVQKIVSSIKDNMDFKLEVDLDI